MGGRWSGRNKDSDKCRTKKNPEKNGERKRRKEKKERRDRRKVTCSTSFLSLSVYVCACLPAPPSPPLSLSLHAYIYFFLFRGKQKYIRPRKVLLLLLGIFPLRFKECESLKCLNSESLFRRDTYQEGKHLYA